MLAYPVDRPRHLLRLAPRHRHLWRNAADPEYTETSQQLRGFFDERSHQQAGDPAKLAQALLQLSKPPNAPLHFLAGTDAIAVFEARIAQDRQQLDRWRQLSASTDFPPPDSFAQ